MSLKWPVISASVCRNQRVTGGEYMLENHNREEPVEDLKKQDNENSNILGSVTI